MSKGILITAVEKYGGAVLILILGLILIKLILKIEKKALSKSTLDEALHVFILNASKVGLLLVLLVTLLGQLNVNTASLITVLGACGAAVALALKDSLGNVAGGIIILINKPFSKDDTVEINGVTGIVHHIDLLTTQLNTFDNKVVTVPNGTITTSILTNYSRESLRRVDCCFGIGYDADIDLAKEILENVCESCPKALKEPAPVVGVASHGDNAVLVDLKVWCETANYYEVKYFLEETVKKAFDEQNINIPYPQVDIHVVK